MIQWIREERKDEKDDSKLSGLLEWSPRQDRN